LVNSPIQAVFIDRDGTIGGSNEVIYPSNFKLYPNVRESILKLKRLGILVFAFTNQPGISKGEVKLEQYKKELYDFGFNGIYLCPHHHEEGCKCRKPSPRMLLEAIKEHNLHNEKCFVIGDRWTDLLAAHEANLKKVIVKTGSGIRDVNKYLNNEFFDKWAEVRPEYIAKDVNDAIEWLLSENFQ
jgi:histidinol-phosphate phosphatase family protein